MIIVQTPLRVSLFGGGTDFPSFYREDGGFVLTTAINKYIFITIKQRFDDKLRVGYTRTEIVDRIDEIQHELIREALRMTDIQSGIEITTMGDIPAGSGLGSSSAVTVGALHAMYVYRHQMVTAEQLAREACEIEIVRLGKPIGVQDQYIAAYGGLQAMAFHEDGQVGVRRIVLADGMKQRLNDSLMLFFTGVTRQAETILAEQQDNIERKRLLLRQMRDMAIEAEHRISSGDLDGIGELLHESWQMKKQLASQISNGSIEEIYERARQAGALGGKIAGAGGGGFLLLYCPPEKKEAIRTALNGLREIPFGMEPDGSKVIFDYRR